MTRKSPPTTRGILQRVADAPGRASASSAGWRGSTARSGWLDDDDVEDDEKTSPFLEPLVGPLDPSVPPFRPGDVIANKYRVDEILGCGGMAWVLRATHLQLNQKVALKFLRFASTRDAVARFFQEGRAAARVSSEAVTRILDVDTLPDGSPFLVMEYLEGRDLEKVVGDPGWLPVTTAVDFAIQACEGLAEVHAAGIVHRDLKPANLFVTRKRNGSIRMKLLDFGISKFASAGPLAGHESPVTSTQALMGSPIYMAPEQMRSTKHVDGRADIWSLGVIVYELLSGGRSPFQGATLPEVCMRVMRENPAPLEGVRSDLPPGLVAVVCRCLEKDPERRYPSAQSLAIALAPYASPDGQRHARRMQRLPAASSPGPGGPSAAPRIPAPPERVASVGHTRKLPLVPTPPLAFANPAPSSPPRASTATRSPSAARVQPPSPSLAPVQPASTSLAPVQAFDSRIAWTAVALSALVVVASAASFAAGVKVSSVGQAGVTALPVAPAAPGAAVGATNSMPSAMPSASTVLVELPAPRPIPSASAAERVYAPEELPRAPEPKAGLWPLAAPAHPNRM